MPRKLLHPHNPAIDEALAALAEKLPATRWLVVASANGITQGMYPERPPVQIDRVSAMSVAMVTLSERIAGELDNGHLQYTLIAGDRGLHLVTALSRDYWLAAGLPPGAAVEPVLSVIRKATPGLLRLFD